MKLKIRNKAETKGILTMVGIILVVAFAMMATTGKLEQWFGVTLFSGPQALDKIVFVSDRDGTPDIYMMGKDGSSQERLTSSAKPLSLPAISLSGNRIIFAASVNGADQIFAVGARGGDFTQFTNATGPKDLPAYNPNGKQFSFLSSGKVYIADLKGENVDTILPTEEETHKALSGSGSSGAPGTHGELPMYSLYAWGPDGNSIAGVTRNAAGGDVLVCLPQLGGEASLLPIGPKDARCEIRHITWASKSPVLAATAATGDAGYLCIYENKGGDEGVVPVIEIAPQKNTVFGKPALSPDGTQLFVPVRSGEQYAIIKMDLSSKQSGALVQGEFDNLSMSPKGDQLLATQIGPNNARDIVVIDPSSGQVTKLTNDGHSYNAIWTPAAKE